MLSATWLRPTNGDGRPLPVIPIPRTRERNLLLLFFKSRFLVGRRGDLLGMTGSVAPALELKKTCGHESSISDTNKPSGTVKRYHFLAQIIQQRGGIHTMAHIPRLIHPKWLKA